MWVEARAKVNWTLDIVGRREDGYHLMDMLMQPITLCDRVELAPAEGLSLVCEGNDTVPADATNLAYRAAALLREATGRGLGAAIRVEKHIPSGAGLGGGSVDAAAVLYGLNALWGLGLSQSELETLGLRLGADVPFCLRGGLARVGGIGEEIEPLSGAPAWPMVITQPCEGLSTGAVFRAYHAAERVRRPLTDRAAEALLRGDASALAGCLGNVLEGVSLAQRPPIGTAIQALKEHGAVLAAMSGSGSAVFGVFETDAAADRAARALTLLWPTTHRCASCRESLVLHR